jgi:L-ascorbate metabolism protein UlaG (beta-lactamase superfamily)
VRQRARGSGDGASNTASSRHRPTKEDDVRRTVQWGCAAAALLLVGCGVAALDRENAANRFRDPTKPHHTPTGFRNNYAQIIPGRFWTWQFERWQKGLPATPEGGWHFPVDRPDVAWLAHNRSEATVTWIGHATVLLQVGGLNVLTDPQFSERASPVSFAGPKRVVPPAIALDTLPHIEVVVISHNHYDHLDEASVLALARQPGGPPRFYVPLGVGAWLRARGIEPAGELDWWDARDVGTSGVRVHLVPVQHWSARTLWDRDETLWGGYVLEAPGYRVFFAGDTGYSRDFADVASRFGRFDLAVLPIGAYEPRWFMSRQHMDPAEAVQAQRDLHAAQSLGVHWGTFVLTDEPLDEPPKKLAEALDAAGVPRDAFWVFRHGETRRLAPRAQAAAQR